MTRLRTPPVTCWNDRVPEDSLARACRCDVGGEGEERAGGKRGADHVHLLARRRFGGWSIEMNEIAIDRFEFRQSITDYARKCVNKI